MKFGVDEVFRLLNEEYGPPGITSKVSEEGALKLKYLEEFYKSYFVPLPM